MHDETGEADSGDESGRETPRGTGGEASFLTVEYDPAVHRAADFRCAQSARVQGFFSAEYTKFKPLNYTRVFVFCPKDDPGCIQGYYTLSAASIVRGFMSSKHQRPQQTPPGIHPPMARIGFMGRDDRSQKGLGGALLHDAALRCARSDIGIWGLVLDAETDGLVEKVYKPHGFILAANKKEPGLVPPRLMYCPLSRWLAAEKDA